MPLVEHFNLVGYVELLPLMTGFVTPVFNREERQFVQVVDEDNVIEGFEQMPEDTTFIEQKMTERYLRSGDKCLFSFKTPEKIYYDDDKRLASVLKPLLEDTKDVDLLESAGSFVKKYYVPKTQTQAEFTRPFKASRPSVALVDDHTLLRNGLASLIRGFGEYDVLFEACSGKDLIRQLKYSRQPDVILLDIHMPEMDGFETASWIRRHYPETKVLAMSMYDTDNSIVRMLKNGAKGYILKDLEPNELRLALESIIEKGAYYTDMVTSKLTDALKPSEESEFRIRKLLTLNERELEFMKLVCTEWTYKEIADRMFLSPRSIDGYRDALFEKLNVRTRVGLAMYAVKNGIVSLD